MNLTLPQVIVICVILVPLVLVSLDWLRLDLAGILTALSLALFQAAGIPVLSSPRADRAISLAFSGLAEPVTITLFSLFVVTRALEKTGVTRSVARRVVSVAGNSERKVITLLCGVAALFSLFMNNLAAGALVLPSAMDVARRLKISPSKLLIPVAYGSCLGGTATYFTSNNIIASNLLQTAQPPQAPLGILDFTPTGLLLVGAGLLFFYIFGPALLADREPSPEQKIVRRTGSELERAYDLHSGLWEITVGEGSKLIGNTLNALAFGERLGLVVVAVFHNRTGKFAPSSDHVIKAGDRVLAIGQAEALQQLTDEHTKSQRLEQGPKLAQMGAHFAEIILIPQSSAEGFSLKELRFRTRYGLNGIAIKRGAESFSSGVGDIKLKQGDSILAVGSPDQLSFLQRSGEFIVLEADPSDEPTNWRTAAIVIIAAALSIGAAIFGYPVSISMLVAACVVIFARVISIEEVYRTMEWQALVLIAGMFPLSTAIINTGLADRLGHWMVELAAPFGPIGLVAVAYIFTGLLSQIVAGQVTTLLTVPVLVSAAISAHVNPQAVAVASAIACSASFLTPLSHPVNALMVGPGNYKFGDFFRAGWLLTIISFLMLLLGMKLFWGI